MLNDVVLCFMFYVALLTFGCFVVKELQSETGKKRREKSESFVHPTLVERRSNTSDIQRRNIRHPTSDTSNNNTLLPLPFC